MFGKSVVAARALPAGHALAIEDLALKKPGTGIPASSVQKRAWDRRRNKPSQPTHFCRRTTLD